MNLDAVMSAMQQNRPPRPPRRPRPPRPRRRPRQLRRPPNQPPSRRRPYPGLSPEGGVLRRPFKKVVGATPPQQPDVGGPGTFKPPKAPERMKRRPSTRWDMSKVQAYLPPEVAKANPIKHIDVPNPRPAMETQRFEMAKVSPPPKMKLEGGHPEAEGNPYTFGEPMPPPTETGPASLFGTMRRQVQEQWKDARKTVDQSGQGNYTWTMKDEEGRPDPDRPRGFGGFFHNIGQTRIGDVPIGKGPTALWEAVKLSGVPAEATERAAGNVWYDTVNPIRDELGVEGDPKKEAAFNAALGVTYSGEDAVKNAYNEALQLVNQGQLTPDNIQTLQARHGVWWREALGQIAFDPLNVVDAATMGGKAIRYAKWERGAKKMFTTPLTKGDDLMETADVVKNLRRGSSRLGQARKADNIVDKASAIVNPRLKNSVIHREAERSAQVVDIASGISTKRAATELAMQGVKQGTPEFTAKLTRKAAEDFQNTAMLWAKMGSDNLDEVKTAAQALKKVGYGNIPTSDVGRTTGVILNELMSTRHGDEYKDLLGALNIAREQNLGAEFVADAWYKTASKVLDDVVTGEKFEEGIVKASQKTIQARKPVDTMFAALFMGLNPGYAARNFYDNMGRMMINNYSPIKPLTHIDDRLGFGVVGAKRGIGQAEGPLNLPFTKLSEKAEQWTSQRIAQQAQADALSRLWPQALKQAGVPKRWQGAARDYIFRDIGQIDNLVGDAVLVEDWRHLDGVVGDTLHITDPNLRSTVVNILETADDPAQALTELRTLQQRYMDYVDELAEGMKPIGHAEGTTTGHAVNLAVSSGKFDDNVMELAEQLSGLEHSIRVSRNRTMKAINGSVDPDLWANKLDQVEEVYNQAVQNIIKRQTVGYERLAKGEITAKTYSQHLMKLYRQAYNDLDTAYSKIIGATETAPVEELTTQTFRWAAQREAAKAGYPSAVFKSGFPDDIGVMHPRYVDGQVVQDAHFGNKVRAILKDHVPPNELKRIQSVNDLGEAELMLVINHFRKQRGLPGIDPTSLLAEYAPKVSPRPQFNLETLRPFPDQADAINLGEAGLSTKPLVRNVDLGPSPDALDSVYTTANQAVEVLDGIIDDVLDRAKNPPRRTAGLDPAVVERLKNAYTETHVLSAEMARRARDFSLLDYADRRYLDPMLKVVFPWHYWYSRSVPNWALSWASRPAMTSHYMKLKKELREYNDNDPNVPEWAKDQLVIQPPGYPGQMMIDWERAFNSIATITETFDDPTKEKDALGRVIQEIGNFGPAIHPTLLMAYAAKRGLVDKDADAMRSYGYLSGQTRAFAALTGKTIEPWLWLKDPVTGERKPWTGGTKFDINKATRKLGYDQGQGKYSQEEAVLGAATQSGEAFENVLSEDILKKYRAPSVLFSVLTGFGVTPRQDWENEVADLTSKYHTLSDQGKRNLLEEHPELGTIWMSWDNEASRMRMLANNVLARIPPMPGEDRDQFLRQAGLSPHLMDTYYDTFEGDGTLADMDRRDYNRFVDGILNLGEVLGVPDKKAAREWKQARKQQGEIYDRLAEQFPGIQADQDNYFRLKEVDDAAAQEFLKTTQLPEYWKALNHELLGNPLVLKYYQEPQKVDKIAESLAYEEIHRRYPDLEQTRAQYHSIPTDDWKARREFRRLHPEVTTAYDEFDDIVDQNRDELRNLRSYAKGDDSNLPAAIDHVIDGKPNASQRGILEHIAELDLASEKPLPPEPVREPSKISPSDKAAYGARDRIYNQIMETHPNYYDLEQEYDRVKRRQGDEAAKIFAQQSGLYEMRDAMRLMEVNDPQAAALLDDDDIKWAAKAAVRAEQKQMWPNLSETWDGYFALPKGGERRAYWEAHPELQASIDWKEQANPEQFYYSQFMNARERARQGR